MQQDQYSNWINLAKEVRKLATQSTTAKLIVVAIAVIAVTAIVQAPAIIESLAGLLTAMK